jgi:hypothetical protein
MQQKIGLASILTLIAMLFVMAALGAGQPPKTPDHPISPAQNRDTWVVSR